MESFTKVSISELSQNLVPRTEVPEAKKSKTDLSCSGHRFDLVRTFGDNEFRVPVQTVWIQGYILNSSVEGQVIELADDTNQGNVERVLVTGCNKVNALGSRYGQYNGRIARHKLKHSYLCQLLVSYLTFF